MAEHATSKILHFPGRRRESGEEPEAEAGFWEEGARPVSGQGNVPSPTEGRCELDDQQAVADGLADEAPRLAPGLEEDGRRSARV